MLLFMQRHSTARLIFLLGPGIGWITLFSIFPLMIMLTYSFLTKGHAGSIEPLLTSENYLRIWKSGLYRGILVKSLLIGVETTIISLLLGYPVAYYLGRKKGRKLFLVLLILIPFWTSYLVRIFSWIVILMENGVINSLLSQLGLTHQPIQLLYTHLGVLIGIVYSSLPFVILPIFAVVNGIDEDLIQAAKVLGANDIQAFWEVTLPLSVPGIVVATALAY
jgi:spermidine/putrescine transport system permease protein